MEHDKEHDHDRHERKEHDHDKHERKGHGYGKREGGNNMGGIFLSKRNLWLIAGGAAGALAALGLGKTSRKVRPAAVSAAKEGYAFKEWAVGKFDELKEGIEDIVAEAVYEYQSDISDTADAVKREKELLAKIEKMVEEKMVKTQQKKEG